MFWVFLRSLIYSVFLGFKTNINVMRIQTVHRLNALKINLFRNIFHLIGWFQNPFHTIRSRNHFHSFECVREISQCVCIIFEPQTEHVTTALVTIIVFTEVLNFIITETYFE